MNRPLRVALSVGVLLLAFGSHLSFHAASNSSESIAAQSGGAAVGTVRFLADPSKPERLTVTQNTDVCGLRKLSKEFIVSPENKGLENVVLTIVGAKAPAGATRNSLMISQHECEYAPHVQAAMVGQELQIRNQDDILHNIHAYGETQDTFFNLAQPIQNILNTVTLDREGVVQVKCDVHGWMEAYVVVAPHPYTAVTDDNGSFRIDGIPSGSYRIRAWHEGLGELDKEITIVAGQDATVNFDVGK